MIDTVNMPIALTGGVVYLLMALTVWRMGQRVSHVPVVQLWTVGALCLAVALLLVASRNHVPLSVGYGLSTALILTGVVLQTGALRQLLRRPRPWRPLAIGLLLADGLLLAVGLAGNRQHLFVVACLVMAAFTAALGWHARQTALRERSRSAALLAWSHAVLALAMLARGLGVAADLAPYQPGRGGVAFVLLHASAVMAALFGSLGFMGLLLDITRRAELRARGAQVAEATRREAAERQTQELRDLLQQRDGLAAERERLLQLLAHEIRQPLHNASGALQAAGQALRDAPAAGSAEATQRLGRAEAVLGEVRSVLDNTLAAATLLSRNKPLVMQDVDLDFLIDLCLGDLTEAQRQVVQVQWLTDLRQAELEPGLVRLALRNLLVNAFSHGGPGVAVQLQVAEQADPPALLLRVIDNGVGLGKSSAALATGERPGLGLPIVRQVAALHGGTFALQAQLPQGVQAELSLPLPAP